MTWFGFVSNNIVRNGAEAAFDAVALNGGFECAFSHSKPDAGFTCVIFYGLKDKAFGYPFFTTTQAQKIFTIFQCNKGNVR